MSNIFPDRREPPWPPHHAQRVVPRLSCPSVAFGAAPLYGLTIVQNVIAFDAAISSQALWTLWNNK